MQGSEVPPTGWPVYLPESGAELLGVAGYEVMGGVVWFRRCPAAVVSPFTRQALEWYLWLDLWHKGPHDLGFRGGHEEIDPRYWAAMAVLKREYSRIEREEIDKITKKD